MIMMMMTFQSDAALVSDKHVSAFGFQSVSSGSGALVWFSRN